jgi:HEAT repeat protein
VRRAAIAIMSVLGFAAGVIGLVEYVRDKRRMTYHGRSLAAWFAALGDTHAGVRDTAAYALTVLVPESPDALPAVIRAEARTLADTDPDVQVEATSALITLGRGAGVTVPAMVAVLERNPNPSARVHAAQVLSALGQDARVAIPVVIGALEDSNATVRLAAVGALVRLGVPAGQLGAVLGASTDSDAAVRAAGIEALIALHASVDILWVVAERAARDPDPIVRVQAAYALASTGGTVQVVTRLLVVLADADARVRGAAATVLGRLGPAARGAAAALERATGDSDREVRAIATQALRAVRRPD